MSRTIETTAPVTLPTAAPMMVPFAVLPGVVRLDERQPGGGPVQPGGIELVIVFGCELEAKWPINAPTPAPAAGNANAPTARRVPGSFRA